MYAGHAKISYQPGVTEAELTYGKFGKNPFQF